MTDRTDLHELLERSTNNIDTPDLAQAALRSARRRRTRRRSAVVAGLASIVVAAVVVSTTVLADTSAEVSPAGQERPTPTEEPGRIVGTEWDPREVDALPPAPGSVAPDLPDLIDPPADAPLLQESPVDAAVLAVVAGSEAMLLSPNGAWRSLSLGAEYPRLELSPSGTRLLVWHYGDYETVTVYDLATGASRDLSYPAGHQVLDTMSWFWTDDETLLLDSGNNWVVDSANGAAEEVPYPREGLSVAVDTDGAVVESGDVVDRGALTDWSGGTPRTIRMARTGRLASVQADADTVVGTSYDGKFSAVVADRLTLTPSARLELEDFEGNYSGGGLGTIALTDDGTVLLRVATYGNDLGGFRVVAWNSSTGSLSLVSRYSGSIESRVVYAAALVRQA